MKHAAPYIKYLETGELSKDDSLAHDIVLSADAYLLEHGVLYHILDRKTIHAQKQIDEIRVCLVIPEELKYDVLTSAHGDLGSGHYGTHRTYATIRLKFFWKGMYNDCKNWVLSSESCNTKKTPV